jgi:predicted aconitase with swiveling domain
MDGLISRIGHPLRGETITGRILIFPSVQGGVAGGWAFMAMRGLGVGPAGLVFGAVNPVIVQGAVAAELPLLAGIDESVFTVVRSGDEVLLDPSIPGLVVLGPPDAGGSR